MSPISPNFDLARLRCAAEVALWSAIEKNAECKERLLISGVERSVGQVADALCATATLAFAVGHGQTVGAGPLDRLEVPEQVNAVVDRSLDLRGDRRSGGSP